MRHLLINTTWSAVLALSICLSMLSGTKASAVEPSVATLTQDILLAQADDKNSNRPRAEEGSPQDPIELDFDDTPLLEILSSIGALTGRNFEVDPALSNEKITIISHHSIPPEMAFDVLEAVFKSRGWIMEETLGGQLIKVYKSQAPEASKLPIVSNGEAHTGFDNYAIHIIQPKYILASDAAEVLKTVGSKEVVSIVFESTNTLIMIDTADGVKNMYQVLALIDVPGFEVATEIFELEYTRAEELVEQLNEVLTGDGGSQGSRPGQTQPRNVPARTSRTPAGASKAPIVVGNADEVLRMVPDERLNALIVVATPNMMQQVRDLIERLDVQTPVERDNMHYIALMHSDAEKVSDALNEMTSTTPRESSKKGNQDGEVQPFEKKVTITPYLDNNALLIIASPQDFEVLEKLIMQLDTPRQQVSVEAVIMEVTLNDSFGLNVEAAALNESSFFGLSNVVGIANVLTGSGAGSFTGAGGTVGIIDGTTEVIFDGVSTEVPNVPLLMRALETLTDVEILSRPNLLTTNNSEDAEIFIGQEIGIPSAQSDVNPNSGFSTRSPISRRDVGITLNVTPQINEGGYVTMKINVISSEAIPSSVGLDPNETGATIAETEVTSEVVVQDGQTGIIGGMIRETKNRSVSQVPVLGDIPLLGTLFKSRSHGRTKQNLVVLVTPRIVTRTDAMQEVINQGMDDFYSYKLDAMFEKGGVIKKTKSKSRARSKDTRATDTFRTGENGGHVFNKSNDMEEIEPTAEDAVN